MADIEEFGLTENRDGITDVAPAADRAAKRLRLLTRWAWPIAFGPFALLIFVAQMPIANALRDWMILPLIIGTVLWAVAFRGYVLYLNYQK